MQGFLRFLGWAVVVVAGLGGAGWYIQLASLDPGLRFGVAAGIALSCLITAAFLLAMAQGLDLLEDILAYVQGPEEEPNWVQEPEEKQDGVA